MPDLDPFKVEVDNDRLEKILVSNRGVLRLDPAPVARTFLTPGKRLGLTNYGSSYNPNAGVCEFWLGSTHPANQTGAPRDEGLSYVRLGSDGEDRILLQNVIRQHGALIMGLPWVNANTDRAVSGRLRRLAKIYDFATGIMYHLHGPKHTQIYVGSNSKEEQYFLPAGVPMGPDTAFHFGMLDEHLRAGPHGRQREVFAQYLQEMVDGKIIRVEDDWILRQANRVPAEYEVGYVLPTAGLHAPPSFETIELQEDSDDLALCQGTLSDGTVVDPELLFLNVDPIDRAQNGVWSVVNKVDWRFAGSDYSKNFKTVPVDREATKGQDGALEQWIYYGSKFFSGTRILVEPGKTFKAQYPVGHNILTWDGKGNYNGMEIEGFAHNIDPNGHARRELFVTTEAANKGVEIVNTGDKPLYIITFFGPGEMKDAPKLEYRVRTGI